MKKTCRWFCFFLILFAISDSECINAELLPINQQQVTSTNNTQKTNSISLGTFNPAEFSFCQRLLNSMCTNSVTFDNYQSCLAGTEKNIKISEQCQPFLRFAQLVQMSIKDEVDNYHYYTNANIYLLHLNRWGANYPGNYYIIQSDGTIIDVNAVIEKVDIKQSAEYQEIIGNYPKAQLWPIIDQMPQQENNDQGMQLVFALPLLNGCHACERAGTAKISFVFTQTGKLSSIKLISLALQ